DHRQGVVLQVLAGHVPGLAAAVAMTADADALALAERIESQADVFADLDAAIVQDGTWTGRQVAPQEFAERPLADEADAGRIPLRRVRQADRGGDAPDLGL